MDYTKLSSKQFGIKWGLISGLVAIAVGLLSYILVDPAENKSALSIVLSVGSGILTLIFIFLSLNEHKSAQGGYLSLGQGIKNGLLVGLISGLLVFVFNLFYLYVIDPTYLEAIREMTYEQTAKRAGEDEMAMEMTEKIMGIMTTPAMIGVISLIGRIIWCFILSLIVGLIIKNDPPQSINADAA